MRRQSSSSSSVFGVAAGVDAHLAVLAHVDVDADADDQLDHRRDVPDDRHVAQDDGLGGQQARGHDRERRVLVAGRADRSVERPRALDHEGLVHGLGGQVLGECGIHRRGRLGGAAGYRTRPMVVTRERAWQTLTTYTKSEALLRHALAVEAAVGGYAQRFGEDEELWRATALLHDFDYEIHPTLDKHPQDGAPILREEGWPDEVVESVLSHAEHLEMPRDTLLKKTLFACDELAGFIHACGLVRPDGPRGARAEVGEEEAEAAVVRGRRPPRRGLRGRRGARDRARRPHPQRDRVDAADRRRARACAREAPPE